jgi:hypothetical protein
MRRPAGGRKRFQAARAAALVIVEAAVRAEEKIFVDRIDRRQTGPRDRHRNRGRQRLRPAMHVDDRALCRQTAEQPRELVRCWPVPSPLHCCGEPRRMPRRSRWPRQTISTTAAVSASSTGPAAAKTIGRCPACLRPMALSKATLACPPDTKAWSRQSTIVSGSLANGIARAYVSGLKGA